MEETVENKRPILLTIICILIIIGAILAPLSIYGVMNNPLAMDVMEKASQLSISVQYAMIVLGSIVGLVAAIGMLKGMKIARTFYVAYSVLALIVSFAASNMKQSLMVTILITIIILGLLYLPNINRYFERENA
ncbi:MAG: hypothetical protein JXQ68_06030 [Campylobacterales bacterium]|nr:hypothetical protein [Campylobacterales bacterium]